MAARGKSQHRSSSLHRETLTCPGESPQEAQKHVLRYMHTCTGPGALALANLQDQQGPSRAAREARGHARPGTRSIQLSEQVNNLGNGTIPTGAGSCLLSQIPPDLHLPYLPWCLPFCVSPASVPGYSVTTRPSCLSCPALVTA